MTANDPSEGQTPAPPICFRCWECGRAYSTPAVNAGKVVACKGCGKQIKLPTPAARQTWTEPAKQEVPDMRTAEIKASEDAYPHFVNWDSSPEECQKRADTLRATIPPDVAEKVRGHFITEAGFSIDKFSGNTWKPAVRWELDAAVYRLANVSPFGILNGFLQFENGMRIAFRTDSFAGFTPKTGAARRHSDEEEEDKDK